MMLSGEHPDAEIDKLLETFGIQVSQIGQISFKNIFNGEILENDMRLGQELSAAIDEVKSICKNWTNPRTTESSKKQFL